MSMKKAFAALVAVIIVFVIFLPTILSMGWAKNALLNTFGRDINGSIQAESIHLSWFGPQAVKNVRLLGPDGKTVASIQSLSSDTSLFSLLASKHEIGATHIKDLNAELGDTMVKTLGARYFPTRVKDSYPVLLSNTDIFISASDSWRELSASGITLHQGKEGSFAVDCCLTVEGNSIKANLVDFPVEVLDVIAAIKEPGFYGVLSSALGDTLNIKMEESSTNETADFFIHATSERLNAELSGNLSPKGLTLSSPEEATVVLTPAVWKQLFESFPLELTTPIQVGISLTNFYLPAEFFGQGLSRETARNTSFEAAVKVPQAKWQAGTVENFLLQTRAAKGDSTFSLAITGSLKQGSKSFPFEMKSVHKKPISQKQLVTTFIQPQELSFALNHLRTQDLDSFFALGGNLQKTFGQEISLSLKSQEGDLQTLQASLNSEKIYIPHLLLQIDQPLYLNTNQSSISGSINSDSIQFQKQKSALDAFSMKWTVDPSKATAQAKFSGKTVFTTEKINGQMGGSLFLDLSQNDNPRFKVDLKGTHVPGPLLALVTGRSEWEPVFGPVLDLDIQADVQDMSGLIRAGINGPNGKLELDGRLSKGVLTLHSPLRLTTKATPELSQEVLRDLAPVLGQLISAEDAIRLTVDPDGFFMPLSFNFSEMHFNRAVLDLGKMHFRNGGDVGRLLSALKADHAERINVWATPLYLKMNAGVLTLYRMDLLVMNRYPIAIWGKVNLPNDKIDLVLGLSPVALAQSLGVTNLPGNYMLQIPIKGSSSNTKIDSTRLMSRIGALVAQSSGGPEGLVIGTVLDLANGKEPKVPPPTTNPFPWGELTVEVDQNASTPNPINGLRQGASKLLKGIFR